MALSGYTFKRASYGGWGTPSSPTVAEVPSIQTTLPTSAYGQTIPVVYGKAKLPAAYIWVPPILTITSSHTEYWDTVTKTTAKMSARLRFARPLVADSSWSLRKLYANGKLIYDGSTGYKQKGLNFRFYDGRSTQGRDPTMVAEEGETDVSAHRGYIDIVVRDFDIIGLGAPPVFEAEIIQDGVASVDVDSFQTFYADTINTFAAMDWDSNSFYGFSSSSSLIRRFSIGFLREIYAIEINSLGRAYTSLDEDLFRYIPEMDRLLAVGSVPGVLGGAYPIILDPVSGASVAEAVDAIGTPGQAVHAAASFLFSNATSGIAIISSFHLGYVSIYTFTADSITRASLSAADWDSRGRPECFTPGEARGGDADIWICAGNSLWKATVNTSGLMTVLTEHATFVDAPVYAVWHDDDVIVWTDNAQAIRIDGVTGAVVWTKTVPYQIPAASSRALAPPDANRIELELFYEVSSAYYFTNLDTGLTRSVAKVFSSVFRYVYDDVTNTVIRTDNATLPVRYLFDASGDGTQRDLSDFLEALMAAGGFDPAEVQTVNIDDVIDGAVIDVTAGVRDIARVTCEPYSIAIFERAGTIIFKRAATDGGFAVDATLSSSGDIADGN
ncbi:hypothetical protein [Mesorhizobium sp.]|uniref:hypothetical protein n=1 Tax=Mesorhizobium sp. TaxID=1871066 RepID=UPI000FE4ED10|nr:hypothetical protein [Mesorhizobium sp.]RWN58765.1 MAG: hypothetical protein EOS00_20470 [Mesorhizobium sp.]